MGLFADAAKEYRKLGWRGTLPLPPGQKEAPPEGFTGHGAPYPSDLDIRKWLKGTHTDGWAFSDGNICLRFAEVDTSDRTDLPVVYAGNNVDGWELIGIDVDDYGDKHGAEQLAALQQQLGPLPATMVSSARWAASPLSGTRVYLVPKGFKYKGKAAATNHTGPKHIDVVHAGHRYLVVWPSTNPHADGALYRWRYGVPGGDMVDFGGIPELASVTVLPEAWFKHILSDNQSTDATSDLDYGDLKDWAQDLFRPGPMCDMMEREVAKYCADLDDSDSHTPLTEVLWRVTLNAIEGHAGWHNAIEAYLDTWWEVSKGKRNIDEMREEIARSINGALSKAKAKFEGERNAYLPDDRCATTHSAANWGEHMDAKAALAAADFGGYGPVVGRMEMAVAKPADEYGLHDDGNGQHFIDIYRANVKYVDGRDSWVVWDGLRWYRDLDNRYVGLAYRRVRQNQELFAKTLAAQGREADDKQLLQKAKVWANWAKRSGNVAPINAALESAIRLYVDNEPVAIKANVFDSRVDLLGCANGTLELTTEPDIRPPRKEDYVTYNTGVDYIPWRNLVNAEGEAFDGYELWVEYLKTFLPAERVRRYVQKVLGHLIVGENPEKRIVFLFGPHDTGKSTMLGALQGALGDYYGAIDIALFKQRDLNPGLIRACPLRVTGMSEVDAGSMDVSMVKKLTGNDTVSAEAKYSNEIFQGRPQFTTVIACNNPPNIKHADEALNERLLVLPFMKTIDRSHRRYERQTQIERHSGVAVLSWLVEGWKLYCEEGLADAPPEVIAMQRDMFSGLNTTQTFIADCLDRAVDSDEGRRVLERAKEIAREKRYPQPRVQHLPREWTAPAGAVYEMYVRWCNQNGVQPESHPTLRKEIGLGKPDVRKIDGKPTRCYFGLRMKDIEPQRGAGWRVK